MIRQGKNKCIAYLLIAICYAVGMPTAANAAEINIGTVDMQAIINDSLAGKDAVERLKAKMEAEANVLKSKQETFKRLEKDFEQQRLVSRPEILDEKERELMKLKREIEADSQDVRRSFQRSQARMAGKILKEAREVIANYAKKNNLTIILESGATPNPYTGSVIYSDSAIDITPAIIKIFNNQFESASKEKKGQ